VRLVDSEEAIAVYETALEPRLYVDRRFVRMDLLVQSTTHTYCPYKGRATYWSAHIGQVDLNDIAWSYEEPLLEVAALTHLLSFDETRVTVIHNLPPAE
jgi:uncharacterized protein (DUF427 family)